MSCGSNYKPTKSTRNPTTLRARSQPRILSLEVTAEKGKIRITSVPDAESQKRGTSAKRQ